VASMAAALTTLLCVTTTMSALLTRAATCCKNAFTQQLPMHRSHRAAPLAVCFVAEASARLKTPITVEHVIMCVHSAIRLHANFASASMAAASARRSTSVINAGHLETAVRAKNTTALHKELANVNLLTTLVALPVATATMAIVSARRPPPRLPRQRRPHQPRPRQRRPRQPRPRQRLRSQLVVVRVFLVLHQILAHRALSQPKPIVRSNVLNKLMAM